MKDANTGLLRSTASIAIGAALLFILLGFILIPYAGIQNDEALFANPLYEKTIRDYRFSVFGQDVPIMLMSYLGTLKTLIYWPILAIFGASPWTVRLPVILLGALTILVVYKLLGPTRGALVALALAADPAFVLTNTFDWGPVAIEHVCLVTGLWLISRRSPWGFFFLGLGLWNKAVFVWALTGAGVAGMITFWPEVRTAMTRRRAILATLAFLIGASPFVIYNIRRPIATFRQNTGFSTENLGAKWLQLRFNLAGAGLFGYVVNEEWADNPKQPTSAIGRASTWIRDRIGSVRSTIFPWVFLGSLALVPLWWRDRAARFALIFVLVAWPLMAFTRDAGGAAHHVVLLWPMPHVFVAATLAKLRVKWIIAGALLISNLLVVNQYVSQFERHGAAGVWTDAIYPLHDELNRLNADVIWVMDWGSINSLRLLSDGRLPVRLGSDPFMSDSVLKDMGGRILSYPNAVFVGYVENQEVFQGVRKRSQALAAELELRKETIATIPDSNGRPMFEILRFVQTP